MNRQASFGSVSAPPKVVQNSGPNGWRSQPTDTISGRYEGEMILPTSGAFLLNLRVDIDPRMGDSSVLNRVSGDIYRVFYFNWPGRSPLMWRIYQESWIVDTPTVNWLSNAVEITGEVRSWQNSHPTTQIKVRIPWSAHTVLGPAGVDLTESSGATSSYTCVKTSSYFRDLTLEVGVCQSVNHAPILPTYDTHSHLDRPASIPQRTLTMEQVYDDAGVRLTIQPDPTIIDDSDPEFARWTDAELHDAMKNHYSQFARNWPNWQMWGLLAGTYDDDPGDETGGIMFDAGALFGGSGQPPERQGFAVFRNHSWFTNLADGAPTNQGQAGAMRQFLYTWVHEAGHAFNFVHSWDKGRPNALSWMNYPQLVTDFWQDFQFQFDEEELLHLRHGNRSAVIMGGDPWASGRHFHSSVNATATLEGNAPIELLIRSSGYFEYMEQPVFEIRLKNLLADLPLNLPTRLNPEYGHVTIYIQQPDGKIQEYIPLLCKKGLSQTKVLKAQSTADEGEDRYSENVLLSYGQSGFYFSQPGRYLIRAVYHGTHDLLIPSNIHRVQIGYPLSKEADRTAQDFFSHEVGMSLYLGGSQSPFLSKGMALLEDMADRYQGALLGAKAAITVANSEARPFFRIQDNALVKTHSANPEKALSLTEPVLKLYQKAKGPEARALNISYNNLVRQRVETRLQLGQMQEAQNELNRLHTDLAARAVNDSVLNEIQAFRDAIGA